MTIGTVIAFCILFATPGLADVAFAQDDGPSPALPGQSIYNLSTRWTTEDGQKVDLIFLRGRPVVAAMIYTSCADTCPLVIQNMLNIHADVSDKTRRNSRFVLFSFDSLRDTPAHLKAFATGLRLDRTQWVLLHGDENAVRELAAALGVRYRRKPNGDFEHSVLISLLNADGVLVYQQVGLEARSRELESKLQALAAEHR